MVGAGAGAVYGFTAGFTFGGSVVLNGIIGAEIGVATDITAQGITNVNNCRPFFSNMDDESIVVSGVTGLLTGATGTQYAKWGANAVDALLFSSSGSFGIEIMLRTQLRYARE